MQFEILEVHQDLLRFRAGNHIVALDRDMMVKLVLAITKNVESLRWMYHSDRVQIRG